MNAQGIKLAEKYLDFNTLIQICETTNNQERLEGYISKFVDAVSYSNFLTQNCNKPNAFCM